MLVGEIHHVGKKNAGLNNINIKLFLLMLEAAVPLYGYKFCTVCQPLMGLLV